MKASLLLVHSPLVGPSSWAPAARVLEERGFNVAVPDLTAIAVAASPQWREGVDAAVAAGAGLPGPIVVAGHSGAGVFLPAIGHRLAEDLRMLVFVDAVIPPHEGAHETSPAMRQLLEEQTVDGLLRRWLEWWSDDIVKQLLPDPADRRSLLEEMPRLPRSFYEESVPVPAVWTHLACAYLKLSTAYEAEFNEAAARGWPRTELDANHLSIHTEPNRVADALESIMGSG